MRTFCTCLLVFTNEPLQIFRFFKPLPPHELGLEFSLGLQAEKPGLGLVGLGLGGLGLGLGLVGHGLDLVGLWLR